MSTTTLQPATPASESPTRVVPVLCNNNCGGRCVLKAHVKDGVVVRITTDDSPDSPEHPQLRGCLKGRSMRSRIYDPASAASDEAGRSARRRPLRADIVGRGDRPHRLQPETHHRNPRQRSRLHHVRHRRLRRGPRTRVRTAPHEPAGRISRLLQLLQRCVPRIHGAIHHRSARYQFVSDTATFQAHPDERLQSGRNHLRDEFELSPGASQRRRRAHRRHRSTSLRDRRHLRRRVDPDQAHDRHRAVRRDGLRDVHRRPARPVISSTHTAPASTTNTCRQAQSVRFRSRATCSESATAFPRLPTGPLASPAFPQKRSSDWLANTPPQSRHNCCRDSVRSVTPSASSRCGPE